MSGPNLSSRGSGLVCAYGNEHKYTHRSIEAPSGHINDDIDVSREIGLDASNVIYRLIEASINALKEAGIKAVGAYRRRIEASMRCPKTGQ